MQESELEILRVISKQVSKTFGLLSNGPNKRRRPRSEDSDKDLNPDLGFTPDHGGKRVSLLSYV